MQPRNVDGRRYLVMYSIQKIYYIYYIYYYIYVHMYHPDIRMVPSGDPVQVVCIRDLGTFDGDFHKYSTNVIYLEKI